MFKPCCCCFGKESKNTSSSRQNEDNTGAADDETDQYATRIYENPNQRRSQHRRVVSEHDYEVPKHVLSKQESNVKSMKTENVYDTPKPFLRRLTSSMRKKRGSKKVNTYEFIDCENNVENEYQTVDELM